MTVTQYIGSRYVPVFADPIEWDNTKTYEPLTIVTNDGNSYTSAQYVPKGIDIANASYWKLTGNYNAQVEQYRKEVANYDSRITTADGTANDALSLAQTNEQNIATLDAQMAGTEDSELLTKIKAADSRPFAVFLGDSWTADANSNLVPDADRSWVPKVANSVGCDYKVYAVSGALISGTATADVVNQISRAKAELTDIARVKYVFLVGGVNDYQSVATVTSTSFQAGLAARLIEIRKAFPYAKTVLVPMNMFFIRTGYTNNPGLPNVSIPGDRYTQFIYQIDNLLQTQNGNVICLKGLAEWFRFGGQAWYRPNDDSSYTSGGGTIHPNVTGNYALANFITNTLYGNGVRYPVLSLSANNNTTIDSNTSQFEGNRIVWNLTFTSRNVTYAAKTYVPLFTIKNGDYRRCICDKSNDSTGNHFLGVAHCINDSSKMLQLWMRDITTDGEASIYAFTPEEITGSYAFVMQAVTEIMNA